MKTTAKTQKLIYGVGINDLNEPMSKDGKNLKFYTVWHNMLERCYSEKLHVREPTYRSCSVAPEWLLLSNFRGWFDANYREGLALDKDVLIPGNRIYRPEACSFVPQYINSLLEDNGANRGALPLGIHALKPNLKTGKINTTYRGCCHDGYGSQLRKTFKTIPEAAAWYSATKKRVVKEQAIHAFEAGDITGDVYQALISRQW